MMALYYDADDIKLDISDVCPGQRYHYFQVD